MIPKEKAEELIKLFLPHSIKATYSHGKNGGIIRTPDKEYKNVKANALICVDEILKAGEQKIVAEYFDDRYWEAVKKEIEAYGKS